MSIDLTVKFKHPSAVSNTIQYARIDNTSNPSYNTIPNVVSSPYNINVENGQWDVRITPVYADQRVCSFTSFQTGACTPVSSFNAVQNGNNLEVTYFAADILPNVLITVNYPNGGSYSNIFTNGTNNSTVLVPIPNGVYGDYTIYVQGVCDPTSGFYSESPNPVTVSVPSPIVSNNITGTLGLVCPIGCTGTGNGSYRIAFSQPYADPITIQTAYVWRASPSSAYSGYGGDMLPAGHPYKAAASYFASNGLSVPDTPFSFVIPGNTTNYVSPVLRFYDSSSAAFGLVCFPQCNPTSGANADWILFIKVVSPNNGLVLNLTPVNDDIISSKIQIFQIM